MTKEALNIANQCRATASHDLACNIAVDGGSGLLRELLIDAARVIEALAQPEQKPVAWMHEWEDGGSVLSLYPRDARLNDQPKSVRPLVYGDTTPPKPEPHNFCPRCGKRLIGMAFAAGGVHTCTPPEGGHQ